jgi:hypothetical protein
MADTEKQNFRCDTQTRWAPAMAKLATMREHGYDIDMTKVLCAFVDWIRDTPEEDIAAGFGVERGGEPVSVWRNPFPRGVRQ